MLIKPVISRSFFSVKECKRPVVVLVSIDKSLVFKENAPGINLVAFILPIDNGR